MAFLGRHLWPVTAAITVLACALFALGLYPRNIDDEARLAYAAERNRAFQLITRGIDAHFKDDLPTARKQFEAAAAIDPTIYRIQFFLGTIEFDENHLDQAEEYFDRAIETDSRPADSYNSRGVVRWRKGDREAALQDFNRAVKTDPEFAAARTNRGLARLLEGQHRAARSDFEFTIDNFEPRFPAPRAWIGLGIERALAGDLKKAESCFTSALAGSPDRELMLDALHNRAKVYEALGENSLAQRDREEFARIAALPADSERLASPDRAHSEQQKGTAPQ